MNDRYPTGTYVTQGRNSDTSPWGDHLHYVPEFAFGIVMSLLSLLSGLAMDMRSRI